MSTIKAQKLEDAQNISDSVKFENYNDLFRNIAKQDIDSAKTYIDLREELLKHSNFDKNTYRKFENDILKHLGYYYHRLGKLDSAILYNEKALKISRTSNDKKSEALLLNNIAGNYYVQGNYHLSLDFHLKALDIRNETNDTLGIIMSYGNIGLIHSVLKERDKCISYYKKAIWFSELSNNTNKISWLYRSLGDVYNDLNQHDKAIESINKSLDICTANNNSIGLKNGLLSLNAVYLNLYSKYSKDKYLDSTDVNFNKVSNLQKKAYDKRIDINYLTYKAKTLIFRKKYKEALRLLNESEKMLEKTGFEREYIDVHKFKSEAYEQMGNYNAALLYFKKSQAATDSLNIIENNNKIVQKIAWFEYNEKLKIAEIQSENKIELEKQNMRFWLFLVALFIAIIIAISIFSYLKLTKERKILQQQKEQALKKYDNIEEAYNEIVSNFEELKSKKDNFTKVKKPFPEWINKLSKRETEVLSYISIGLSDKEISEKLFLSTSTVRTHCQRIYGKLLVKNRIEASNIAKEYGLI